MLVLLLVGSAARGGDAVTVTIVAPLSASVGETFMVDLVLGAVQGLDVAEFFVSYGATIVPPSQSDAVFGPGFPDTGGVAVTPAPGHGSLVVVNYPGFAGVAGVGTLVRLPFRALTRGSAMLTLSTVLLGDSRGREIPTVVGPPVVVDVGVAPAFEKRATWVFDPRPGGNGDGIASPGERVYPRIRLKNVGTAGARGVRVHFTAQHPAVNASGLEAVHDTWPAGWAHNGDTLLLDIAPDAEPHVLAIVVDITADNGGPWRYTVVLPISHPPVLFQLRSNWLYDPAPGGNKDGAANPGERLQPRVRLRNAGVEAALNVRVTLAVEGAGVAVVAGAVGHSVWPAGEARNNDGFLLAVAPDAAPTLLLARVRVEADNGGPWVFDIPITIVDLAPEFSFRSSWTFDPDGNHDGAANPGERIRPRIRLRNSGPGAGRNVRISLSASDPNVTVIAGLVHHAVWPSGEARNSEGLLMDVAPGAVGGVVEAIVHVSADAGGAWTFVIDIPIVVPAVEFALRSVWVFDPAPGGNKNGVADAGESVFPRVRLRNEGSGDAADVRVVLSSTDPDITIVVGTVSHASWAASSAGNNEGFVIAVAPGALSHEARFTVHVAARSRGPWEFEIGLPVAAAPVMARRSFWVRDKETGDDDGDLNPGETVEVRARLRNTGAEPARDVVVTLVAEDSTVTVTGGPVAHATWPAGDAHNNVGLAIKVAASASGNVGLTLIVTAANGGPWRFTYTVPIVRRPRFVFRQAWLRDKTTGDGDGVAEPGERVEVRARIRNEGSLAAEAVTVTLHSSNSGVGVAEGVVAHATWPVGEGRNNVGLVVDLADDVGSGVEFVLDVTAGNGGPWQFQFSLITTGDSAPASPARVTFAGPAGATKGDINGDAVVDILDILTLARVCGAGAAALPHGDLNGDGRLSVADLVLVHTWRADIPSSAARARAPQRTLLDEWLQDARRVADGSAAYADGVKALERIRAALTPDASVLLPNYPNPFNPETWIPFDLAQPAIVTLTIYGVHGRRVRRIDLGWRDAGRYRTRAEAGYWDGGNEAGDPVASGVYVCELRAGDHREARRIVIRR